MSDTNVAESSDSERIANEKNKDLLTDKNQFEITFYLNLLNLATDPTRFTILRALKAARDDGLSASELEDLTEKSGNALHTHVSKLCDAQLVYNRKRSPEQHETYSYYTISGIGLLAVNAVTRLIEREREVSKRFRGED